MRSSLRQTLLTLGGLAAMSLVDTVAAAAPVFGGDLSYVNEMEDCGAHYSADGRAQDPYAIFSAAGANIVRLRLWHTPTWTNYSNLADVKRSARRAREHGMQVMLAFHYSDTWADPQKQEIPAAWKDISSTEALADALYTYTRDTLLDLDRDGLMPAIVGVGNEINTEILRPADTSGKPINWPRNAALIRTGIRGVRDAAAQTGKQVRVLLHIAQPENLAPWMADALQHEVTDFDIIGLSFYEKWSEMSMAQLGAVIADARQRYARDVMVIETAYPWTQDHQDAMGNLLGDEALASGYPATRDGQRRYLLDLRRTVLDNGGSGLVYWEPAWVSTRCKTPWGKGSSWENATLFDFRKPHRKLEGMEFLNPATAPATGLDAK
jgi:arabinogalactan endo-1,4-beta-galactosidase